MKLKYYLRGLAVGVILTTIILSIANADNKPMTDAQVRKRALELGMIEGDALKLTDVGESSGMTEEETEESRQSSSESEPETETERASSESENLTESEPVSSGMEPETERVQVSSETEIATTQEMTSNETVVASEAESLTDIENSEATEGEEFAFTIKSGDSSYSVSKALAAAGLVEDAVEFDNYLCNYGYSRKIRTGTYTLVKGMTHEEIAKAISR